MIRDIAPDIAVQRRMNATKSKPTNCRNCLSRESDSHSDSYNRISRAKMKKI